MISANPFHNYPCLTEVLGREWLARTDNHPLRRYLFDSSRSAKEIARNIELQVASSKTYLSAADWTRLNQKLKDARMFQSCLSEIYIGNHLGKTGCKLQYEPSNGPSRPDWLVSLQSGKSVIVEVHCPDYRTLCDLVLERLKSFAEKHGMHQCRIELRITNNNSASADLHADAYDIMKKFKTEWVSSGSPVVDFRCNGHNWSIVISHRSGSGTVIVSSGVHDVKPPEVIIPAWIQDIVDQKKSQTKGHDLVIIAVDVSLAHEEFSRIRWSYVLEACQKQVKLPKNIQAVVLFYRNIDKPNIHLESSLWDRDTLDLKCLLEQLNFKPV
jgi:hypothetical protein